MANLSPAVLIFIIIAAAVVALLIGYFLGSRFGGKKSVAMKEATEQHDTYKSDVREHFEQTSAIMSRMVDDYRDMYEHLSDGAERLADMHPEKRITPPPAPEAITSDKAGDKSAATAGKQAESGSGAASVAAKPGSADAPNMAAVMNSDSSNDRPWNKEKGGKKYGLE